MNHVSAEALTTGRMISTHIIVFTQIVRKKAYGCINEHEKLFSITLIAVLHFTVAVGSSTMSKTRCSVILLLPLS